MQAHAIVLLIAGIALAGCHPSSGGPASPNLAGGRPVTVFEGRGEGAVLTDGVLAAEGTFPRGHFVALQGVRSAGVVDLGRIRPVAALALQASTSDVYFVETSTDAVVWRVIWRVSALPGLPELRTWTTVLRRPVEGRWLRVRTTTARTAAVSELQAFEPGTPAWPLRSTAPPGSPLPVWPRLGPERLEAVYEALAALLVLAIVWGALARRAHFGPREERTRRVVLATLALVSLLCWPNLLNFHFPRFVHLSEMFHYYMGAKYLPELGYTGLYACTVVADAEDGVDLGDEVVRDLRDNRLVPAARQLERADECHARFTPRRWEAFRRDTAFFRDSTSRRQWFQFRNDHGFNGTPAWAVAGGLLAGLSPASWHQLVLLALVDLVLLAAVFVLMGRGFGLEAAALAAGYFGLNFLSRFGWTGGSLLRYDWLLCLVGGVVALRRGRPALAGFALGASTMLRLFPACALLGLGLKSVVESLEAHSLRPMRRHGGLVAGGAAAALLFFSASAIPHGTGLWVEFAHNTSKHMATQSRNFVGLASALSYDDATRLEVMTDPLQGDLVEPWRDAVTLSERRTRPARWLAGVAFLLLLGLAVRRAPDWTAATLGLGLMPILAKLSGYYYSGWLLYAALWPVSAGAGLAVAVFTWATNVIPQVWPLPDQKYAWLSLAAVGLSGAITLIFAWRGRDPEEPGPG